MKKIKLGVLLILLFILVSCENQEVKIFMEKANESYEQKEYVFALEMYESVLEIDKENKEAKNGVKKTKEQLKKMKMIDEWDEIVKEAEGLLKDEKYLELYEFAQKKLSELKDESLLKEQKIALENLQKDAIKIVDEYKKIAIEKSNSGDYSESQRYLSDIKKMGKDDEEIKKWFNINDLMKKADENFDNEQFNEAKKLYGEVLTLFENHEMAHSKLEKIDVIEDKNAEIKEVVKVNGSNEEGQEVVVEEEYRNSPEDFASPEQDFINIIRSSYMYINNTVIPSVPDTQSEYIQSSAILDVLHQVKNEYQYVQSMISINNDTENLKIVWLETLDAYAVFYQNLYDMNYQGSPSNSIDFFNEKVDPSMRHALEKLGQIEELLNQHP